MNNTEPTKRKRTVTKTKYPLPDSRSKFEQHLQIIQAYASISNDGKKAVHWKDFENIVDFNPQYVSGNNNFMMSLGLLEKAKEKGKHGYYIPTKVCLDLSNAIKWNEEDEAKSILRDILIDSWFYNSVKKVLEVQKLADEETLTKRIGKDAHADPEKHYNSLKILIEYLKFAELIKEENGKYFLAETKDVIEKSSEENLERETAVQPDQVNIPDIIPKVTPNWVL
ncbi:hypothetical protein [Archaeoglobus sp.]